MCGKNHPVRVRGVADGMTVTHLDSNMISGWRRHKLIMWSRCVFLAN